MKFKHKKLQEYEYKEDLGHGGQGKVVRIQDEFGRRNYALKLLSSYKYIDLFKREADTLEQLNHKNIVQIYDKSFDEKEGEIFILMEYMCYGNIINYLKRSKNVTVHEKLLLIQDAANALKYAHNEGVLHRDIKPQNIFVTNSGKETYACLGDFGVAKNTANETLSQTAAGMTTLKYLPLEVISEKEKQSATTDIYSLGMSMYEILTGEHAYHESNIHAFFKAMEEREIRIPSTYDKSIPSEVDALCLKAIEKEKRNRYQSIEEFSKNLKRCIKLTRKYGQDEELSSEKRTVQISDQKEKRKRKEVGTVVNEKEETKASFVDSIKQTAITAWNSHYDTLKLKYNTTPQIKWGMIGTIGLVLGYMSWNMLFDTVEKSARNVPEIQLEDAIRYVDTGEASKKEYEQILQVFTQREHMGDVQAYMYLGTMYEKGLGTEIDYDKALNYYKKALEQGNKKVITNIAELYFQGGHGIDRDYKQAKEYLEELVKEGDRSAEKKLGELYQYGGYGVEKSFKNAFDWYIRALEKGDNSVADNIGALYDGEGASELGEDWNKEHGVAYNIANFYVHGKQTIKPDYSKAVEWYKQAVEKGDLEALIKIAELYERGDEKLEKDEMKSLQWYEKVLESGEKSVVQKLVQMYLNNNDQIKDRQVKVVKVCINESQYIDSKTLILVGHICRMGEKGFIQNYKQAVELYKEALNKGEKSVLQEISDLYFEGGHGLEKDGDKGYEFMDKAVLELKIDSSHLIAKAYKEGDEYVKKDYTKALEWCLQGVVRNNKEVLLLGARIHYENSLVSKKGLDELIGWFENAAQHKNSDAMYHLGYMYEEGRGVEKNEAEALKWYIEAVKLGNTYAMHNLGFMYEEGRGVEQDDTKALELYLKAAELEDGVAMRKVSRFYQGGKEVMRYYDDVIKWKDEARKYISRTSREIIELYEEKVNLGSKSAIMTLASIYAGGLYHNVAITDVDYNKAIELYKKEAELGNSVAMVEIGKLYCSGKASIETETNSRWRINEIKHEIGVTWYEKAANSGNVEAMCFLGRYHAHGTRSRVKDYKKSLGWYQKAVMHKSTEAMYQLGNIYYRGYGVKKSSTKAKEWYIKSAMAGNKKAMLKLGNMYKYGLGVEKNLDESTKWYKMSRKK